MEYKDLAGIALKAAGDAWEVSGYASTFSTSPDTYGDVVAPGAFRASIGRRKTRLLWQHQLDQPIGRELELREDSHGLWGRWSIVPTTAGKEAHELLKVGLIDSFSIGFTTNDSEYRSDGVRVLKALELFEVSLVTIPANEGAVVEGWKGYGDRDREFERMLMKVRFAKARLRLRQLGAA